jgi:hypothetical protein
MTCIISLSSLDYSKGLLFLQPHFSLWLDHGTGYPINRHRHPHALSVWSGADLPARGLRGTRQALAERSGSLAPNPDEDPQAVVLSASRRGTPAHRRCRAAGQRDTGQPASAWRRDHLAEDRARQSSRWPRSPARSCRRPFRPCHRRVSADGKNLSPRHLLSLSRGGTYDFHAHNND